ncbi:MULTISPECIES: RNA-binding domain-containing protein [Pseudomonas]|uniref:RNA-binding domain-containing protein n=1 Tax=Pseudomonas TaxID=286 RepID=UPI000DAC597A|nr:MULTISPECIES: RNA-binding domain-containing protein [Pseudomonas]MCA5974945.1 putative DNA binding domain-containing protein [Pseudomonas sp. P135]MCH5537377.1 putative DNA binding domain-containing protein [Pseudomonas syringae pv. syringae]MCH5551835.1 putative DNA binding domain-containing protein [Pseudomonas syringae pv. syringae]MCH5555383.1 putative DNA binding domain-containing protein [Pseudomonas syringae pv. syringae]MCH5573012.1 putative DNA binding domain-containing protein [Ps
MDAEQQLHRLLASSGESEVVEFKEAKNGYDFSKLGKYFSALSNEANLKGVPSAWLVFGVRDNLQVVGSQFREAFKDLQSLKKEVADKVSQRLSFIDIHTVLHPDGRVLLFEIPAAPQGLPVTWEGHYYGRDGESLGPLSLEEIERIRGQNRPQDWSAGICPGASLADLSTEAIALARREFATKHPKMAAELPAWSDETFLNKSKLTIQGQITRTAILLLGKPEAAHWLNPASPTISWILKDRDGSERDYQHFSCPLLASADEVYRKIRNLKYRYMSDSSLFPEEVDQYDPFIIREALNNAIAHQDYQLGGKVSVVEFEDGQLCFSNPGAFIPGSVEQVIQADAPESRYRNRFLTDAMVNLNMIDTIGSGIRKMFLIQKNRFFPLPEYQLEQNRVQVTITGRVLDISYARKLAELPNLALDDIILLDRVQKHKSLSDAQVRHLKAQRLIEGRKPNFHISAQVARHSDDLAQYILNRGIDDTHYKRLICELIQQSGSARRSAIDKLLVDKLPDVLDIQQKAHKIKNLLQSLKKQGVIEPKGKLWQMSKG